MFYYVLKIKDNEYKCKLATKNLVNLEHRLGVNPLNVLTSISETNLPKLEPLLIILHESLQSLEHGISMDDVYDMYDAFIEEGHNLLELMPIIIEIFKVSGLLPKDAEKKTRKKKEADSKN